jgi:hypothetical protein
VPNQPIHLGASVRAIEEAALRPGRRCQEKLVGRPRTFVTDLTHFLTEEGAIAPMPGPARRLAEFLGNVVIDATTLRTEQDVGERVKCRRRPGRKPCPGEIETDFELDTDTIVWWCPVCGENGYIRNWKGTLWDCATDSIPH